MGTSDRSDRESEGVVVDVVQSLVAELHPYQPPPVHLDSDLARDLGLDSLAIAELLVRLEDRFEVSLPTGLLRTAATPRDLVRATCSTTATTPAVAGPLASTETTPSPQEVATLGASLDWHASTHPDRLHVRVLGEDGEVVDLTYDQLRTQARAVAAGLLERGVSPGESVALMLPTSPDYFVTFLGVVLAGAVPVPIYPPARLSQLEEHLERQSRILDNARAVMLVTVPEARQVSRLLRANVTSLRDIRTPGELPGSGTDVLPVARPDDIAMLQYTSGSTGNPKGVVLTHRHLLANVDAMARAARVTPDDVFVSWLPLYHDMGLIGAWLGSLHVGFPLVAMSPLSFLLRPARWLQAISEHRATISAAPNFGYELCLNKIEDDDLTAIDLTSWRLAVNGAEPVNPTTLEHFAERFAPCGLRRDALMPVYGLAEAAVGLAFPPVGRGPVIDRVRRDELLTTGRAERADTGAARDDCVELVACGRPLPGYQLRIVDRGDRELAERTEGRIQFRGPSATSGYFRNPDATRALFHGDWLDTGDLGYLADGDLYVTGRIKDLIIRAGRNLHPDELETAIGRLPDVRRGCVAVFAVPDPASGTEDLVVVAETRQTDPDAVAELRTRVQATAVDILGTPPDDVILAPPGTVPKTSSGKIRRNEARLRYERDALRPDTRAAWRQLAHFNVGRLPTRWRRARRGARDGLHTMFGWVLLVVIGLPLCAVVAVLPSQRLRWRAARTAARTARCLSGTPIQVHAQVDGQVHAQVDGHEPPPGPTVFVANHASWIDGIVLAATLPGPLRFVVGEVFEHRLFAGFLLRRIGAVFVQRQDREEGVADAAHLAQLTRAGQCLVVFPEGGLSPLPGLRPFHLGGFAAAAAGGASVVPVAIRGTRWILRPGHRTLRRGAIDIVIGTPISPTGDDWRAGVQLLDAARDHILRHGGEPDLA